MLLRLFVTRAHAGIIGGRGCESAA